MDPIEYTKFSPPLAQRAAGLAQLGCASVDGRTRLEGRTWYNLDMQPAMYWTAIADTILHAIHNRVLEHIKSEAERRS